MTTPHHRYVCPKCGHDTSSETAHEYHVCEAFAGESPKPAKGGETIERVLYNPKNGKLAIGIRLRFIDKYPRESLGAFDGKYSIWLEPDQQDAWAIDNEDGVWVLVPQEFFSTTGIEDWGPL